MTNGTRTATEPVDDHWRWTIRNGVGDIVVSAWGPADGPPPPIIADCTEYLIENGLLADGAPT